MFRRRVESLALEPVQALAVDFAFYTVGGTKEDVQKFFSYFDRPVDVGSINLIVR